MWEERGGSGSRDDRECGDVCVGEGWVRGEWGGVGSVGDSGSAELLRSTGMAGEAGSAPEESEGGGGAARDAGDRWRGGPIGGERKLDGGGELVASLERGFWRELRGVDPLEENCTGIGGPEWGWHARQRVEEAEDQCGGSLARAGAEAEHID